MKKQYDGLKFEIELFCCEDVMEEGIRSFYGGDDFFDDYTNAVGSGEGV